MRELLTFRNLILAVWIAVLAYRLFIMKEYSIVIANVAVFFAVYGFLTLITKRR